MMKSSIPIFLFFYFTIALSAQSKQDYIWIFGQDMNTSAYNGYIFDFNSPPMEVQEHDNNIGLGQANTSISDKEGNLLMYFNGCAVMNKDFQMMDNGDSLSYNIWQDLLNIDCGTGYNGFQDVIILPDPRNSDTYIIIHKPKLYNGPNIRDSIQVWYSVVDMSKNNGLGCVVEKNLVLDNSTNFVSSYLTAINHSNQEDWWIIQPVTDDSLFHIYKLDQQGLSLDTILNSNYYFANGITSSGGSAKFSPDGTKYAWYSYHNQLHIYDFDRMTGVLSNHKIITIFPELIPFAAYFSSVEWSPNSRFIYTASSRALHQIDLWEEDVQENGIRLIDTYNGTQDPFSTTFFMMALAPDCKIYMCPTSGTRSYHVIHKPNELGSVCNFVQNGLRLPQISNFGGMPNHPRFRVDEEEKCDPTLTSVFGNSVYYRRDLKVYPSPSDGRYKIEIPEGFSKGTLTVLNLDGQVITDQQISNRTSAIDVDITSFPNGYYHVELYPNNNKERVFWGTQVVKQ